MMDAPQIEGEEASGGATPTCFIEELLPEEVLCCVLHMVPKNMVAIAARTCRRWFRCSPAGLRFLLPGRTVCTRMELLQWAVQHGFLLDENKNNRNHLSAFKAAAEAGNLQVLQWLYQTKPSFFHISNDDLTLVCDAAAARGHLTVLQWLRGVGCCWDAWTCASAARGSHLAVLQWARAQGCPWNEDTCTQAAATGQLHVLQWARANGCNWNEDRVVEQAVCNGYISLRVEVDQSAREGRGRRSGGARWRRDLEELTFCSGCGVMDEKICDTAARNGHWEVVKWAKNNGCPFNGQRVSFYAAKIGNLEMLQWSLALLVQSGERVYCWNQVKVCCIAAAAEGHLEILKWLKENSKDKWDEELLFSNAAENGHLPVLQWLQRNGNLRWNERTFKEAILSGQLEVLKWADEEGYTEWPRDICRLALQSGHWEMFVWTVENGCLVDESSIVPFIPLRRREAFRELVSKTQQLV
ncbi:Ankyrin repeat domain-containing protein [Balamuthia mandrillaris]